MSGSILVVGAAGGVGQSVSQQMLASGRRLIATVMDAEQEAQLRAAVPGDYPIVQLDLSSADNVQTRLGPLLDSPDCKLVAAVHCAAISPQGPLEFVSLEGLRSVLEVNTLSALALYQLCLPHLRQSQGRLILISSFGGKAAFPFIGEYSISKFALEGMADVMRREALSQGVSIVLVEPGSLKTGMTAGQLKKIDADLAQLGEDEAALYGDLYRGFKGIIHQALEQGTEPEQVAATILGALNSESPQARYVVGADAEQLLGLVRNGRDSDLDAAFLGMFAQAAHHGAEL